MTELDDLKQMFEDVERCCLHDPVWRPDDVDTIVKWYGDHETGSESSSQVLVRLKNKDRWSREWGYFEQSEDYTGHGCQCGSYTARDSRLGGLLSGVDDWKLTELLGIN